MADGTLASSGPVQYFVAKDTVLVAATSLGCFKLCRVMFGADGSIYVPFPYLDTKCGSAAVVKRRPEDGTTVHLKRDGQLVNFDVKFSHHPTGAVHFKNLKGTDVLPRRQSFSLSGSAGRVFELNAYWLHGFARFDGKSVFTLPFQFLEQHPTSLMVRAEWILKAQIASNLGAGLTEVGPNVEVVDRKSGSVRRCVFLGQPPATPLQDHLLMISVEPVLHAEGANSPTMVFRGGWDDHFNRTPASQDYLSFMYPVDDDRPEEVER